MGAPTGKIDQVLDLTDAFVGGLEALFGGAGSSSASTSSTSSTSPASPGEIHPAARGGTPVSVEQRSFSVEEVIDADTGRPVFIVTNGRDRAECSSRAFALRVKDALG